MDTVRPPCAVKSLKAMAQISIRKFATHTESNSLKTPAQSTSFVDKLQKNLQHGFSHTLKYNFPRALAAQSTAEASKVELVSFRPTKSISTKNKF